jgi:hypothetical protein
MVNIVDDTELVTINIGAGAGLQDFTTFDFYDPGSNLYITPQNIVATGITQGNLSYLSKDFGENWFGFNHVIKFKTKITRDDYVRACCFGLTNIAHTLQQGINTDDGVFVYWQRSGATPQLVLRELTPPGGMPPTGQDQLVLSQLLEYDTWYYLTIRREDIPSGAGLRTLLEIWLDPSTLLETLTVEGIDKRAYRLLTAMCGSGTLPGDPAFVIDMEIGDYYIL